MFALWKKEVSAFFTSLAGYLIVGVFVLSTSLFLWIIPGNFNIPYGGYATLDPLFWLAPWLYLFLIPAVTMHLFAEEKRSGTLELLYTKPVTDWQIVNAKYLAGLTLAIISLLPTLIFFASVSYLAQPAGNVDFGATWGSYAGLALLAAVYTAVGVFTSSITGNQIIAFVLAVVICFTLYSGFGAIADMPAIRPIAGAVAALGIDFHYASVSRGVIDSRNAVYFASIIVLFLALTRMALGSRKW
ncbi:MAG: gliding motility-associated ABC transporter permease subunit GldF [Cytophagaceae bacterium]|nr:gliding motility-associated ABC transporter permease subunit GldF [Cytophagaceae bacterium]